MKKILLAGLALLGLARTTEAAPIWGTVQIGTSTTLVPTLQAGGINISSGNIRNLAVSTATINRATINQSTVVQSTVTNLTAGVLNVSTASIGNLVDVNFTATVSTITNLTSTNFNTSTGSAINWTTTASTDTSHTFSTQNGTEQSVTRSTFGAVNVTGPTALSTATVTGALYFANGSSQTVAGIYVQTVFANTTTSSSTVASAFVPTNLSASITCKTGATCKVKVTACGPIQGGATSSITVTLTRNGTNIGGATTQRSTVAGGVEVPMCMSTVDSPNSASAITYAVAFFSGGGQLVQFGESFSTIVLEEIAGR